jgi:outer membrane protein assembly factor BamA
VVALSEGCGEIDGLLGSRLAVANAELRFPLLRPFGVSPRMYGPVPVEVALFIDNGVVWREADAPSRRPVSGVASSAGVTLRTNIVGLGLGQFDIARRLRGAHPQWVLQFNLAPAF